MSDLATVDLAHEHAKPSMLSKLQLLIIDGKTSKDDLREFFRAHAVQPDPSDPGEQTVRASHVRALREEVHELEELLATAQGLILRLRQWKDDLLSGMYVNCVYCGHRYGPDPGTPVALADVLKAHIEECPEHPLSAALRRITELEGP